MLIKYILNKNLLIFLTGLMLGAALIYLFLHNNEVEKIKVVKVTDQQAILEAVKKEREEIYKNIKQTKYKQTVKKPDGETIISEKIETDTDLTKLTRNDLNLNVEHRTHETEQITKETFDRFNFALFAGGGVLNFNFNELKSLENLSYTGYLGVKIIYNITPTFSPQLKYSYEIMQNRHDILAEIEKKL